MPSEALEKPDSPTKPTISDMVASPKQTAINLNCNDNFFNFVSLLIFLFVFASEHKSTRPIQTQLRLLDEKNGSTVLKTSHNFSELQGSQHVLRTPRGMKMGWGGYLIFCARPRGRDAPRSFPKAARRRFYFLLPPLPLVACPYFQRRIFIPCGVRRTW